MRFSVRVSVSISCLALGLSAGCVVPQPRGEGMYKRVKEPRTGAVYHLYLPVDYVQHDGRHPDYPNTKRWPLVMTFHGMKPYDNARPQEREWEKQADIYGYIVCAPELHSSDSFMEYPLTKEHGYVIKDRENVSAIMDHVFVTTLADPRRVLSTSWSSGGYLAHYLPNRYPKRFSCIATRLSNFSHKLMIEETVPSYRNRVAVGIFAGDSDLPATKTESEEAVAWYTARHFRVVRGKMIDGMGHSRIPQVAAAFFAEQIGIKPLHTLEAAKTVNAVHMVDYFPPPDLIAKMSPKAKLGTRLARRGSSGTSNLPGATSTNKNVTIQRGFRYVSLNAGRDYPFELRPTYDLQPDRAADLGSRSNSPSQPPTGAGSTRVASVQPRKGNWLEPVKSAQPSESRKQSSRSKSQSARRSTPTARRAGEESKTVRQLPKPAKTRSTARRRAEHPPTKKAPSKRSQDRRFDPRDAGSRDYKLWTNQNQSRTRLAQRNRAQRSGGMRTQLASSTSSPRMDVTAEAFSQPRSRAKRVNIHLNGPAVGTSPVYLSYSADLASQTIEGADFLWKDNGVWIGDEPSGVKILQSPGLHRLTVLLVTKDNVEYRGMATVQVLQRDPSDGSTHRGTR